MASVCGLKLKALYIAPVRSVPFRMSSRSPPLDLVSSEKSKLLARPRSRRHFDGGSFLPRGCEPLWKWKKIAFRWKWSRPSSRIALLTKSQTDNSQLSLLSDCFPVPPFGRELPAHNASATVLASTFLTFVLFPPPSGLRFQHFAAKSERENLQHSRRGFGGNKDSRH